MSGSAQFRKLNVAPPEQYAGIRVKAFKGSVQMPRMVVEPVVCPSQICTIGAVAPAPTDIPSIAILAAPPPMESVPVTVILVVSPNSLKGCISDPLYAAQLPLMVLPQIIERVAARQVFLLQFLRFSQFHHLSTVGKTVPMMGGPIMFRVFAIDLQFIIPFITPGPQTIQTLGTSLFSKLTLCNDPSGGVDAVHNAVSGYNSNHRRTESVQKSLHRTSFALKGLGLSVFGQPDVSNGITLGLDSLDPVIRIKTPIRIVVDQ